MSMAWAPSGLPLRRVLDVVPATKESTLPLGERGRVSMQAGRSSNPTTFLMGRCLVSSPGGRTQRGKVEVESD